MYLSLHCHHQNDSCIKIGSDPPPPHTHTHRAAAAATATATIRDLRSSQHCRHTFTKRVETTDSWRTEWNFLENVSFSLTSGTPAKSVLSQTAFGWTLRLTEKGGRLTTWGGREPSHRHTARHLLFTLIFRRQSWQFHAQTPSTGLRHPSFNQRKDVVNQCLEFVPRLLAVGRLAGSYATDVDRN